MCKGITIIVTVQRSKVLATGCKITSAAFHRQIVQRQIDISALAMFGLGVAHDNRPREELEGLVAVR